MSSASLPLRDRVAVVTGATSGIGRLLAERLAALGATTVVVGRGDARARATAEEIQRATGRASVESIGVQDLSVLAEMNGLADELLRRYPQIHLLVNNAGAFFSRRERTPDGLERTFALNVLAPFVLTSRLASRLEASAPSRVVQIASAAHRAHRVPFDDLQAERAYRGFEQYGRSKLELILETRELARRLQGSGVTVNAVHPGFIRSGFGQNNGGAVAFGIRFASYLFGRSLKHGVDTPLFVATDPSLGEVTGEYFSSERVVHGSPASRDPAAARRLYDLLSAIAGLSPLPEPATSARAPPSAGARSGALAAPSV